MFIEQIDENKKSIHVAVPLTKGTEKTRIKRRSILNEYGLPVATRSEPFTLDCYVEWQIGYDVVVAEADKLERTTLKDVRFTGANGKLKAFYELSEYVWYFYKWGFIEETDLNYLYTKLEKLPDELFDQNKMLSITRSHPIEKKLNGVDFSFTRVEYPLLVHKFDGFEIITEIIIKEKQYAVGVQPMLYFCFPVTKLLSKTTPLVGRIAEKNENAIFEITRENYGILLRLLHLFGMLSENHKKDVLSIIETVKENA